MTDLSRVTAGRTADVRKGRDTLVRRGAQAKQIEISCFTRQIVCKIEHEMQM